MKAKVHYLLAMFLILLLPLSQVNSVLWYVKRNNKVCNGFARVLVLRKSEQNLYISKIYIQARPQEARVALGYRLFRIVRALQTFRVHP